MPHKSFLLFYIGCGMIFTTIALSLFEIITISLPEWLAFVLIPVFLSGLLLQALGFNNLMKKMI